MLARPDRAPRACSGAAGRRRATTSPPTRRPRRTAASAPSRANCFQSFSGACPLTPTLPSSHHERETYQPGGVPHGMPPARRCPVLYGRGMDHLDCSRPPLPCHGCPLMTKKPAFRLGIFPRERSFDLLNAAMERGQRWGGPNGKSLCHCCYGIMVSYKSGRWPSQYIDAPSGVKPTGRSFSWYCR